MALHRKNPDFVSGFFRFTPKIVFYEGIPNPVLCEKIAYYKEPYFKKRLLPKVEARVLSV